MSTTNALIPLTWWAILPLFWTWNRQCKSDKYGAWGNASHLQYVVILKSGCDSDLLRNNQGILEILIRDVVELLAMPYRGRKVGAMSCLIAQTTKGLGAHFGITRAWPRARGPMSRNENLA